MSFHLKTRSFTSRNVTAVFPDSFPPFRSCGTRRESFLVSDNNATKKKVSTRTAFVFILTIKKVERATHFDKITSNTGHLASCQQDYHRRFSVRVIYYTHYTLCLWSKSHKRMANRLPCSYYSLRYTTEQILSTTGSDKIKSNLRET